jgi:hypothetical protein
LTTLGSTRSMAITVASRRMSGPFAEAETELARNSSEENKSNANASPAPRERGVHEGYRPDITGGEPQVKCGSSGAITLVRGTIQALNVQKFCSFVLTSRFMLSNLPIAWRRARIAFAVGA